ncbi:MAG: hypothetical protein RIR51_1550 [Bacteroidota bacterium]|jgi:mono/diheme cytochrome c family protein
MKKVFLISIIGLFLGACQSKEEILTTQYAIEGMSHYQKYCQNCHQENGKGLEGLYPAINSGVFEKYSPEEIIQMARYGVKKGDTLATGKIVENYMPENKDLKTIDLAEIVTYLRFLEDKENFIRYPEDSVRIYFGRR